MAKALKQYVCQSCGSVARKWAGQCDGCGQWNTMQEEAAQAAVPKGLKQGASGKGSALKTTTLAGAENTNYQRYRSGLNEFDRVTGGGLVPGSALLIGGDPGIGKSTLLLQVVCRMAQAGKACLYVSGEEAADQIRMRAERLGLSDSPVTLAAENSVRAIISVLEGADAPDVLIIDSIQTMYVDSVESAPGTVTQVRTSAQEIIRRAKAKGTAVIFVGHVTKDGQIAGPRVLEHLVDAVLYFEGDRGHQFRILRTVKNRFGPTDEIGVFEMAAEGLQEVGNPSALFLNDRQNGVAGSAVFAGMEGTRPLMVEVQALAVQSAFGTPRRAVIGWDANRLAMVLAVLETRTGLRLSDHDIFLNFAGGIRISEPAADLAVAAALISAHTGKACAADAVYFGEIGLSGEVRGVPKSDLRMKEAQKLGFSSIIAPPSKQKKGQKNGAAAPVQAVKTLQDLADLF